jgi:hypothetical protein
MGFGDDLKKLVTQAADGIQKLQDLAEDQRSKQSRAETDKVRERDAEIRSLPTAQVQLTASGWATGQWSGQMYVGWNEISADAAGQKLLWFELFAPTGEEAVLDGHRLHHWSFQIYGWHGDGTYDLVAIAKEREATGWSSDYLEWEVAFADSDDSQFFFTSSSKASSVTVSGGGKRFSVSIHAQGAPGDLTLAGEISRA